MITDLVVFYAARTFKYLSKNRTDILRLKPKYATFKHIFKVIFNRKSLHFLLQVITTSTNYYGQTTGVFDGFIDAYSTKKAEQKQRGTRNIRNFKLCTVCKK